MSANAITSRMLIEALSSGLLSDDDPSHDDQSELTNELRRALLAIGSETPFNVAAVANIEFAGVDDDERSVTVVGPKLSGEPILLSHLFWCLEDSPMPEQIHKWFPDVTEEKWHAALRFIVLLLSGLQRDVIRARS